MNYDVFAIVQFVMDLDLRANTRIKPNKESENSLLNIMMQTNHPYWLDDPFEFDNDDW